MCLIILLIKAPKLPRSPISHYHSTKTSQVTHITVPRLFPVVDRHCFVPIAGVVGKTDSFGALSANHVFLSLSTPANENRELKSRDFPAPEDLLVWRASLLNHVTGHGSRSVQTCMLNEPQQITWWKSRGRDAELLLAQCVNKVTCPRLQSVAAYLDMSE